MTRSNSEASRPSAQIIQFPAAKARRFAEAGSVARSVKEAARYVPAVSVMEAGAWYHAEAVREGQSFNA